MNPIAPSLEQAWCERCRVAYYVGQEHDCGPVTFERRDSEWDWVRSHYARYRAFCPTCSTATEVLADASFVARPSKEQEERCADPSIGARGEAAGLLHMFDLLSGNAEQRREFAEQKARADRLEAQLRRDAFRQLRELGCTHAKDG